MKIKSAFLPLLIVGIGFLSVLGTRALVPSFQVQSLPWLPTAMYFAVAVGLYLNVSAIELAELLKNRVATALVLFLGVPIKIFLPGLALLAIMPSLSIAVVFLCATVIAQIDPILSAKNIDHERFSQKSGTIMLCWFSFDEPITVLFAFYIFLPLLFSDQPNFIGRYAIELSIEIVICCLLALLLNAQKASAAVRTRSFRRAAVIAVCVFSGLAGRFLLPASLGLMVDPFSEQTKERALNVIFVFSCFVIGVLTINVALNIWAGTVLGAATFFIAQPLVSLLFIQESKENLLRVMFGHQNGMIAILLMLALELQLDGTELLSVTLPAIVVIALFYALTNYWIDKQYATSSNISESD
ncbi:MAG: hypothetical protein AB8B99_25100 [Phormidesmis sp.]